MRKILKKDLVRTIATGSLIFYVFSGISSVLNYAFYPLIARFVSVAQYGEIQFLVSMFTQLAVGFVVLNILAIIISAEVPMGAGQKRVIKDLNIASSVVILLIVTAGSAILYSNQSNLGIHDSRAILALGVSLVISVPFTVAIGRLQGSGRFVASGAISALATLLKLIFSVTFVIMGFGVVGAICGIGIGMLITLIITEFIGKKQSNSQVGQKVGRGLLRRLLFIRERAAVATIVVTTITLLSSADSIISRIYLDAHGAGEYAAIATLTKIVLAVTSPLMWLALPPAIARDRQRIILLLKLTAVVALLACIAFTLFPIFFLKTLLGIDAGDYASLLPIASVAMGLYSVAFILVCVGVCMKALRIITITSAAAAVCYFTVFSIATMASLGSIYASLYGQIIAATCFIIGGILALHQNQRTF